MPRTRSRRISAPGAVLAVAVLGSSMTFVDASSVNIAIPDIAKHFPGSSLSNVSWVLNAYSIVFAAFLVGGGQLADLLGRRRAFGFSTIAFTLSSALCALAPSLGTLIAARVVEAAAAALLIPSSLAIVLETREPHERTHAVAMWLAVAALAAGFGPPLGALLITASSWRLVFLINVPLGLLTFVLARRVIVESRAPGRRYIPDLLGALVLALAIAALVLAVVKGSEWGWANARVVGSLAASLLLGGYFVLRSTRERVPVIDPLLLRIPDFVLSNASTTLMATGFFAYTLGNVLFLTSVWHYSILHAGLALTPEPIVAMAVAKPTIRLVGVVAHRVVLVAGAIVWAGGMAYFAIRLGASPDFLGGWLPGMAILGVGGGLVLPTLSGVAVDSVPGPRFAVAASLNSVATQVGAALGVAVLIAVAGEETLSGLRNGWLFAGACILAGVLPCLALAVGHEHEAALDASDLPAVAAGSLEPLEPAVPASALPSLLDSTGERAAAAPQTVAEFLRNVHVFAELPDDLLEQVAALATSVSLRRGEWLFHEGEQADGVYVVRVGHLEVVQEQPELEVLNTLTRGAVLGELALLSGSVRSGSARALRDTEMLKIEKGHFDALLRSTPKLALSLTRVLSVQLQASRALPARRRARPVTIALRAMHGGVPLLQIADQLSREMCRFGRVAVLHPGEDGDRGDPSRGLGTRAEAAARFGPLVEGCELDHDHVIMVCGRGPGARAWDDFCLSRADRVLAVVGPSAPDPAPGRIPEPGQDLGLQPRPAPGVEEEWLARMRGCDLVGYEVRPGSASLSAWIAALKPSGTFALSGGDRGSADVARMARRLAGRSLGVVFGGAGARAFAHLGVLEVLMGAGMRVDRVGGVSMGAFVGALLATGHDSASIDACCYEEWVRRNPINDYTLPRASLIKGRKSQAMLDRVFGEARIEELSLSLYCASVDLNDSSLRVDRDGPLAEAVAASIALPLIAPPIRRGQSLLTDGSLLDNLPLEPMSASGEGPVLAIDIKSSDGHRGSDEGLESAAAEDPRHGKRLPPLTDTMARIALLSSANTDESARQHADMTIKVPLVGVGMLEFHQIDQARAAGRSAAAAALEDSAPDWLLGGPTDVSELAGRRTVLRT
ncbi:MAG TPA: MFS transporter [Solirubrobacteraceae bacterium]|jgi:EmrB/QacA subfamily drug resistance transporter|nr:MFS transporter [Solirubrobacteraceae bacterium]